MTKRDRERRQKVAELFRHKDRFLLACHVNADGDAIGSLLALGRSLQSAGKRACMVSPDGVPAIYRFLPGWERVQHCREGIRVKDYDTIVTLDTATPERLGQWSQVLITSEKPVVNIDHHLTNSNYGDINWVEEASSTGEMVFDLLEELGWYVDHEVALSLYTAMVTDTGSFRFENTSWETHLKAARLLGTGVDPARVSELIFESKPLAAVRILGKALDTLQISSDGRIAWMTVSREAMEEVGATGEDVNGIVNFARGIAGVRVGFLLQETEGDLIKVGLRSAPGVDVSRIAQQFAGGGHPRAAGCRLVGKLEEVRFKVLDAVEKELARGGDVVERAPQCSETSGHDIP